MTLKKSKFPDNAEILSIIDTVNSKQEQAVAKQRERQTRIDDMERQRMLKTKKNKLIKKNELKLAKQFIKNSKKMAAEPIEDKLTSSKPIKKRVTFE
jgi:hypothetical protein